MAAGAERRLPCMFSGICPWSPCDRARPRASVSTLGSMTGRLRAGRGARCPRGSPAPGRDRSCSSGGKKERAPGPARRPARRSAPPPPPGLRVPTPGLCPVPQFGAARCREEETEGSRPGGARARWFGWARAAAAEARAQLPGARIRTRRALGAQHGQPGRGAAAQRGGSLCCGCAPRLPPSVRRRAPDRRGLSGARCTPLLSSPPLPCPCSLARAVTSEECEVPASLSRLLHASRGSQGSSCSPEGDAAGREEGARGRREVSGSWAGEPAPRADDSDRGLGFRTRLGPQAPANEEAAHAPVPAPAPTSSPRLTPLLPHPGPGRGTRMLPGLTAGERRPLPERSCGGWEAGAAISVSRGGAERRDGVWGAPSCVRRVRGGSNTLFNSLKGKDVAFSWPLLSQAELTASPGSPGSRPATLSPRASLAPWRGGAARLTEGTATTPAESLLTCRKLGGHLPLFLSSSSFTHLKRLPPPPRTRPKVVVGTGSLSFTELRPV